MPKSSFKPLVGVYMGSKSDWLGQMEHCCHKLDELGIPYEVEVVSAHRTPRKVEQFAVTAPEKGIKVIIACAGGAAHLAGGLASHGYLPVIGVPAKSSALSGIDSLYSTVQMPQGIPVGTMAIGVAGAINAALYAAAILAPNHTAIRKALLAYREKQTQDVLDNPDPREKRE